MKNNYKIDLHTHSIGSDGRLKDVHYERILREEILDYVAITDHNDLKYACHVKKYLESVGLSDRIIIGEEILTGSGEVTGLFLTENVPGGMSLSDTIKAIKYQNGLIYVPHPFDWVRYGMLRGILKSIINDVDIIEIFNPKYILPAGNRRVEKFAIETGRVGAASSDTHMFMDIGRTYSIISDKPTRKNLVELLENAQFSKKYVPKSSYLWQVGNMLRRAVRPGNFRIKRD